VQKTLKNLLDYVKGQILLILSDYFTFCLLVFILEFQSFYSFLFSKIVFTLIGYFFHRYLVFKSEKKVFIHYIIIVLGNIVFCSILVHYINNFIQQDLITKFIIDMLFFFINYILLKKIFST
jgi:putative flippase GtrA